MQQGDVKLFQTIDDGEIAVSGGIVEMSGGLETAAYISLFGGNERDTGSDGNSDQYWGNSLDTAKARKIRSETQNLLRSLPLTSGNLLRVEDAVKRDLQWMVDERVASSLEISTSIPALNTLGIEVTVKAEGEESTFTFVENWKAAT